METNEDLSVLELISLEESWNYLKNQSEILDLISRQEKEAESMPWWKWLPSKFYLHCRSSKLHKCSSLIVNEKTLVAATAQCSFSNNDNVHARTLYTLFKKLNPSNVNCPRYGPHWESIGFQGSDPSTDFRGVGLLGLLLPLSLVVEEKTQRFMLSVLNFSRDVQQGFPFMVLSLNITQIALTALKENHLDKLSADLNSALKATSQFYGGVLFFVYDKWKTEKLTLVESGHLLKCAEKICKKDVSLCVRNFANHLNSLPSLGNETEEADPSQILLELQIS